MKKILIVVDAPGPAEFIEPVIPLLKQDAGIDVSLVTVKESPSKILSKYNLLRCDHEEDAELIYKNINPDILLVATSSLALGPYVNNVFTELARADGKKIICFQDFWANHRCPVNFKMMKYWQVVLAPDEMAKNFLNQDGYEGQIVVTGNPAFDKYRNVDVAAERKRLRGQLGISNDALVLLYIGQGTPQSYTEDEITFRFFINAVRALPQKEVVVIARSHPRDEKPSRYKEMVSDISFLDTSAIALSEAILPVADIVVSMYATNLIHACYLRIPAISILLPNAGKKKLEQMSLSDFPPNSVGATIGVYKGDSWELENIINKIRADADYRAALRKTQENFFPMYANPAAEKSAQFIQSFI